MPIRRVVAELEVQEARLEKEVRRVREAISALRNLGGNGRRSTIGHISHVVNGRRGGRRKMSAAGRARIAAAQKARWAKIRAQQAKQPKRAA